MRNEIKWFEIGTEDYPIPLYENGKIVLRAEELEKPVRATLFLPTMKDVTKDQFYGELMREVMCDPSLMPAFTDMVKFLSKKTETQRKHLNYNYVTMGDPGLGKTYVMSKLAALIHPRGAFMVDCHDLKDPKYLYQTVSITAKDKKDLVDAFLRKRARAIINAQTDEEAKELAISKNAIAVMKSRLGNNAVTYETRENGRTIVSVDWNHPEITQRVNPEEINLGLIDIIDALGLKYEKSNDMFQVKEEDGPLIRALFDPESPDYGRMIIADECNRLPETEAWLTFYGFFSDKGKKELNVEGTSGAPRVITYDSLPETFMFLGTANPPTEAMGLSAQKMPQPLLSRIGHNINMYRCDEAGKDDFISRTLKHMTGVPAYLVYGIAMEMWDKNPKGLSEMLWSMRTVGLSKEEIKKIPEEEKFNIEHIDRTIKVAQRYGELMYEARTLVQEARKDPDLPDEYKDYLEMAVIDLRYCFNLFQASKTVLPQTEKKKNPFEGIKIGKRRSESGEYVKHEQTQEEVLFEMNKMIMHREKNAMFVRGINLDFLVGAKLRDTFLPQGVNAYISKTENPEEALAKIKGYAEKLTTIAKGLGFEWAGYVGQDSVAKLYNAKKEDFEVNANEEEYKKILTESFNRVYNLELSDVDLFASGNVLGTLNALVNDEEYKDITAVVVPEYHQDGYDEEQRPFKRTYVASSAEVEDVSDLISTEQFIDSMVIKETREHNINKLMNKGFDDKYIYDNSDADIGEYSKQIGILNGSNEDVFVSVVKVNNGGEPGIASIIYNKKSKKCGIIADFTLSENDLNRMKKQGVEWVNVKDIEKQLESEQYNDVKDILEDRKVEHFSMRGFISRYTEGAENVSINDVYSSLMGVLNPSYIDTNDDYGMTSALCFSVSETLINGDNPNIVSMTNVDYQKDVAVKQAVLLKASKGR